MKHKIAQVFMALWCMPIVITAFNLDTFTIEEKCIGLVSSFSMLGLSLLWLKK